MAQPDIAAVLLAAGDPNPNVRTPAEQQLVQAQESNYAAYVSALAGVIANGQQPAAVRQLAAISLKNAVDAKEDLRRLDLQSRWSQMDHGAKEAIRQQLLSALGTEEAAVRHTVSNLIGKLSAIDLPKAQWPGLIQALLANMSATPPNPGLRQATLETLGYVCEEMAAFKEDVLQPEQVNLILTAVVAGMRPEESDQGTRLAATTALTNAIEFASHNFENENERNYIMQMVCTATTAADIRIRVAAFTCLHEIAASYYAKLPPYMQEIFNITVRAIKEDQEEVGLQAIEFWSTVCDYELDLAEAEDEPSHNFIKAVAPHLVPVLLEQLTKQDEQQEVDENSWNMAMAAGTCLNLIAKVAGDEVVPLVMPFVTANIAKKDAPSNWHEREAATFAFGSILEGPQPQTLLEIAKQALSFLLAALKDPVPYVRDTTAWTVGRIFENVHSETQLLTPELLPSVVQPLLESLKDDASIAIRVCDAIGRLADGFVHYDGNSSPLSPFFKEIVAALLGCAQRHAGAQIGPKLQISAFEAICDMVRAATQDTLDTVSQLIPVFLGELGNTFSMPVASAEAQEKQSELQGQLCGVLQVIIQKLSEQDGTKSAVLQYADQIMQALLQVMGSRSESVHEEAMLAVGALTYACGRQFAKYLQAFYPFLIRGLKNHQEWQVCMSTVGVVGDVCRNMEEDIAPYCDEIMATMVNNLGSNDVHRSIKPQILSAFGDIALVLGNQFQKYLETVRRMLQQAMHLSIVQAQQSADDDFMDYNNELRIGILEAYSGIFQGLGPGQADQHCAADVLPILAFINSVGHEVDNGTLMDDTVAKNAINLLGDIVTVIPSVGQALNQARGQDWEKLLTYCHNNSLISDDTEWAFNAIQSAQQTAQ